MPERRFVILEDEAEARAVIAPELGAWLLRYTRSLPGHGPVEALHYSDAVVERYPREMYAGSPILFPLVGFNHLPDRDHHCEWNGQVFPMPQHGFARRSPWKVVDQGPATLSVELAQVERPRDDYPFLFRHRLTYRLAAGRLYWEQEILNVGPGPMPFGTGFHPYFAVPFTSRSEQAACFVELPDARRMTMHGRGDHFTAKQFPAQNWSVAEDVSATMFLADLRRRELALVDPVSELEAVLNFEGAPQHRFVALWAKSPAEPYFCLEPWTCLPNAFHRSKDQELIILAPGQAFQARFWMELRPLQ